MLIEVLMYILFAFKQLKAGIIKWLKAVLLLNISLGCIGNKASKNYSNAEPEILA